MVKKYIPRQGDIILVSFNPTSGHEQKGSRPAIVVSASEYNMRSGMILVCPITSKAKGYAFEIPINTKKIKGSILVDQIRAMDWFARKLVFLEKTSSEYIAQIRILVSSLIQ